MSGLSEKLRLSHLGFGEPNGQVLEGFFVGETPETTEGIRETTGEFMRISVIKMEKLLT